MRYLSKTLICVLFFSSSAFAHYEGKKEEIKKLNATLSTSQNQKSEIYFALTKLYFEDQDVENAYKSFLLALEHASSFVLPEISAHEKSLYTQALQKYYDEGVIDPQETGRKLVESFEKDVLENKDYFHLHFLLSTAYANLGKYELFFENFYRCYPYLQNDFLAYKTQAVLHFRLMQLSKKAVGEKIIKRKRGGFSKKALVANALDPSLYKMLTLSCQRARGSAKSSFLFRKDGKL